MGVQMDEMDNENLKNTLAFLRQERIGSKYTELADMITNRMVRGLALGGDVYQKLH